MQVTYDLKVNEINKNFIDSIKTLFANREIRVTIEDVNTEMEDKALAKAIKEGLKSESISKEEFLKALIAN